MPKKPEYVWKKPLPSNGLGGIAANKDVVVIGLRDTLDKKDVFRCYQASDGELLWQVDYEAQGRLDYGNSPRATPLIHNDVVYLQGAFGNLKCVELETGTEFWSINLLDEFGAKAMTWGNCWSPILVDGKLIVQPGGKRASIVALDPDEGTVIWETKGNPAAYSSPIVATFSKVKQIIAYDKSTLGGWDVKTGKRLWTLKPPESGDFNVPTPIQIGQRLFVTTENNGSRLYEFDKDGKIKPKPVAKFEDLSPDTHTPVVVNGKIFGAGDSMFCLSAKDLKKIYAEDNEPYGQYASIIASKKRALVTTLDGQMVLFRTDIDKYQVTGKFSLAENGEPLEIHSHPAIVGTDLYIRVGKSLRKMSLAGKK